MEAVHVSPYGGTWYPGCRTDLERLLDDLTATSRQRTGSYLLPEPCGFVVPHAGLEYSGSVAAAAYRYIEREQPARAVILGFAHQGGPAGISIPDIQEYETPLGTVALDRETMGRLASERPFQFVPEERICDHSVEIQLPLLQRAAPQARVLPLFAGPMDARQRQAAAERLLPLLEPGTIFLVSSDLTHFGRAFNYQPFTVDSAISAKLSRLDHALMEGAASLDAGYFLETISRHQATLCGRAPIALWLTILSMAQARAPGGEIFQEILDYRTSGDITGDYQHTVSYGALGYFPARSLSLSETGKRLLLESAAQTLAHLRATGEHRPIPPPEITPELTRRTGVFVSLHQGRELLGCVGNRTSYDPLAENVPEMTLRAALDDPRFPTVLSVEGPIDIEISVLSPLKPVASPQAFRIGEHGASLECSGRQALLLPQVGRDREWNAEQFLGALANKAGLGSHGFRNAGAKLSVFRAQVFH